MKRISLLNNRRLSFDANSQLSKTAMTPINNDDDVTVHTILPTSFYVLYVQIRAQLVDDFTVLDVHI